jgi:hypothetical protein
LKEEIGASYEMNSVAEPTAIPAYLTVWGVSVLGFRPRQVDIRLPGKGNSNSHGTRQDFWVSGFGLLGMARTPMAAYIMVCG